MTHPRTATAVSFMAYFAMSAMLAPIGLLTTPLAATLELPVTEVTARFSWLTGGILVGSGLAVALLAWLSLRVLFIGVYLLAGLALVSLLLPGVLPWWPLGVVGACFGIGLAAAALTITRVHHEDRRASMLVLTDGCFSVAGFVMASVAAWLVLHDWHWSASYQLVALICAVIVVLALAIRFPVGEAAQTAVSSFRWPAGVWLCMAALFLYTLGQNTLLWWLPSHLAHNYAIDLAAGGQIVGQFWLGMLFAQLSVAWWVLRVGTVRVTLLGGVLTAIASTSVWLLTDVDQLYWAALVWGFANLGLLKMVLTLATGMVDHPSPTLVSALLFCATAGTAVSPALSAAVVEWGGSLMALQGASAAYAVLALLLAAAVYTGREQLEQHYG